MTNFSTNQVMQFYGPETVATMKVVDLGNGKKQLVGSNGVASDVVENVEYVNAESVNTWYISTKSVSAVIKVPAKANEYIVRVSYPSIAGAGDEAWTTKTVSVFGNDNKIIATKLKEALNTVFAEDGVLEASASNGAFSISQVIDENRYVRGTHPILPINFTVSCNTVLDDAGNEVKWATFSTPDEVPSIAGIYKVMDLEYFAMGERGDQYRGAGWPDVIPTKYEVYPELNNEMEDLYLYQIHYSYKGTNQNSHKSEKDLYLCGSNTVISKLVNGGTDPTTPGLVK